MAWLIFSTIVCLLIIVVNSQEILQQGAVPCYTREGRPQRCTPPFENAAYNLNVDATNTCGMRERTEFCLQVRPIFIINISVDNITHFEDPMFCNLLSFILFYSFTHILLIKIPHNLCLLFIFPIPSPPDSGKQ